MVSLNLSVICLLIAFGVDSAASDRDAMQRLRKTIFANYSTSQRPVMDQNRVVEVGAKMWVFHVEDVNDTQQTIKFHGVMQMSWRDEYLTWNPDEFGGIKYIMTHNLAVWTPKLILLNSAEPDNFFYYWNLPVKVWAMGYIYATVELSITATCAFDFSNFPYDTQRCPVAFYLGATMDQVAFTIILDPELRFYWRQGDKDSPGNKLTASNWEVTGQPEWYRKYFTANGLNDTIGDSPGHAATMIMEIWITFRRRISYFQLAVVLPAVLTSMVTVTALMPMETMYSLGMLMLNLLAQATYVDNLFLVVPMAIGVVPRIVKYYGANMILTVLAVFSRLFIQWSLNVQQKKDSGTTEQDLQQGLIVGTLPKSRIDVFFSFATPSRLYIFFVTSYALVYVICAGTFL